MRCLDDPGPIMLPLAPARYTTSKGAVRGYWCLQVHLASSFARGVQRNVDEFDARPWIADFRMAASFDNFPFFGVLWSGYFLSFFYKTFFTF